MKDQDIDALVGIENARQVAEDQLLPHLRDDDGATPLKVTLTRRDGHWWVSLDNPGDGVGAATGSGETFAEAWHKLTPNWAPQNDDTKGGR